MKKLTTALLLLLCGGISATAHEGEEHTGLNYSVYRGYTYMNEAPAAQVLATQQLAGEFMPGWNATTDKLTGGLSDMYGPVANVAGNTNAEKAQALLSGKLSAFGIDASEWKQTRDVDAGHASFVDFERYVAGHKVAFSKMIFRFTPDGKLQRVKAKLHSLPEDGVQPSLSANDIIKGDAITRDMGGMVIEDKSVEQDWVWFPIPAEGGYVMHPAWKFHVTGIGTSEMPFDITGYIDATNGELLYRSNSVNETFEVTVKANVHLSTPVAPTSEVLMRDMRVSIGGNNYATDDTGFLSVASANAPLTAEYVLRGPWSRVRIGNNTPSFTANMSSSPASYTIPVTDTTTPEFRGVSAFYHVNNIHAYVKKRWPSFVGMDNDITTNIDVNGNTCNAFYNNGQFSINFYKPQNACRAFSIVSDIVYHEYGHGISYRFYAAQNDFFQNGGLGEGNSDVWAMCINEDGVVGDGAYYNGGSIRNYTGAPKVFPQDLTGEVHADGEIIAGAWWDVAKNINSVDTMAQLFAATHYDLPNGPEGTEGDIYHDILISAIMNDDDDNNLANGTPHFSEIVEAFARHGIYLLSGAEFDHTEVDNQSANTGVVISGNLTVKNPAFLGDLYLHYRDRYNASNWDSVIMNNTTGNTYTAQIPGAPAGTVVDYYFSAEDVSAISSYGLPDGYNPVITQTEVTLPYQYGVGLGTKRYIFDFENGAQGWQLSTPDDNASAGIWEVGKPVGTTGNGLQIQTDKDKTTGTGQCLLTGNGSPVNSVDDVDDGKTTAVTPVFDLPFHEPIIEYYRWYSNDRGSSSNLRNDFWTVEIKASTSQLWRKVDYTKQSDQQWRRRIFRVSEYFPTGIPIQMRFIAEDRIITNLNNNGQNIIEAAVDDFFIYEGHPTSVEDLPKTIKAEVYPNPADNVVNITVPGGSRGTVKLYDITGKILSEMEITDTKAVYSINTSGIAPGTYMVLVQTQYAVQNTSVVISHQ